MSIDTHIMSSNRDFIMIGNKSVEDNVFEAWPLGDRVVVSVTEAGKTSDFILTRSEVAHLIQWMNAACRTVKATGE